MKEERSEHSEDMQSFYIKLLFENVYISYLPILHILRMNVDTTSVP